MYNKVDNDVTKINYGVWYLHVARFHSGSSFHDIHVFQLKLYFPASCQC